MLIVMDMHAGPEDIQAVCNEIRAHGLIPHEMPGAQRTAIGITGNKGSVEAARFESMRGVMRVIHVTAPYKLVSREFHEDSSIVMVGNVAIGGTGFVVMAGPCAVESPGQIDEVADRIKRAGAAQFSETLAGDPRWSPRWTLKTALGMSVPRFNSGERSFERSLH